MTVSIKKVSLQEDIQKCLDVRLEVFVVGQKISLSEELDGKDWGCEHYLLSVNDAPVGVARVRFIADYAKIERVGILDAYQGKGLGRRMMNVILSNLEQDARVSTAKLSSQTHAISFYEHLGFIVCSEEYKDAGILHRDMKLDLSQHKKL